VNDTLRAGLEKPEGRRRPRYVCPTFSTGPFTPGVDLTKANQLAAALEDEELIKTLRQTL